LAKRTYMPRMQIEHIDAVLAGTPLRSKLLLLCVRKASEEPWRTTCPEIAPMLAVPAGNRPPIKPSPSNVWRVLRWMAEQGIIELEAADNATAGATAGVVIRYRETKRAQPQATTGCNGEMPPGFVRFWSAWPRHERKSGKSLCLDEWTQRKLEERADHVLAVLAAKCRCPQWSKDGGQYIPAPVVWLRAAGYDADPADLAASIGTGSSFKRGDVPRAEGDPRGFAVGIKVE